MRHLPSQEMPHISVNHRRRSYMGALSLDIRAALVPEEGWPEVALASATPHSMKVKGASPSLSR